MIEEEKKTEGTAQSIQDLSLRSVLMEGLNPRNMLVSFCTPPPSDPKEFMVYMVRDLPAILAGCAAGIGFSYIYPELLNHSDNLITVGEFTVGLVGTAAAAILTMNVSSWFIRKHLPYPFKY